MEIGGSMSYRIDPDRICSNKGCTRPRATGEEVCSQCARLARAVGAAADTVTFPRKYRAPEARRNPSSLPTPPRCTAYLSTAGDVITLKLTGGGRFTQAEVEAITRLLSHAA
jgi:hypothetical protein